MSIKIAFTPKKKDEYVSELITLTEICENKNITDDKSSYSLQEVVVNPSQVVFLRADATIVSKLEKSGWPEGLDKRMLFTKVYVNMGSNHSTSKLVIAGGMSMIKEKLSGA